MKSCSEKGDSVVFNKQMQLSADGMKIDGD